MTDRERDRAASTSEPSREQGTSLAESAREMGAEAKDAVKRTGQEVKTRANRAVDERTSEFADRGDALAEALRSASSTLRERQEDTLVRYADRAAEQVERFGDQLRRNDLKGLLDGLEDFARDHTALYLGGTFVGGLAVARFLRSSSPEAASRSQASATGRTGNGWQEEVR